MSWGTASKKADDVGARNVYSLALPSIVLNYYYYDQLDNKKLY